MGRLSQSGPQPHQSGGPVRKIPAVAEKAKPIAIQKPWRACDECGYSHDGQAITRAKYQVEVPGGTLYFCGHHFTEHELTFIERHYAMYDIREVAVAK